MPTRDQWYEELCRLAVAEHFGVPLGSVVSTHLEGRTFAGAPPLRHQIDLYVELIANVVAKLDIVVDAKWRGSDKVDLPDVDKWASVAASTGASKAMMITNTGFTAGARAMAEAAKIATAVVVPTGAAMVVPVGAREDVLAALVARRDEGVVLYTTTSVTRSLDPPRVVPAGWSVQGSPGTSAGIPATLTRAIATTPTRGAPSTKTRVLDGGSGRGPSGGGGFTRGGGWPGGWSRG